MQSTDAHSPEHAEHPQIERKNRADQQSQADKVQSFAGRPDSTRGKHHAGDVSRAQPLRKTIEEFISHTVTFRCTPSDARPLSQRTRGPKTPQPAVSRRGQLNSLLQEDGGEPACGQ